jgi:hypothetical protein
MLAVLALTAPVPATAQEECGSTPPSTPYKSFSYRGENPQRFAVPAGVTQIFATVEAAHGGQYDSTAAGGPGGGVDAVIPVTPGECLLVYVGGQGTKQNHGGWGWADGGGQGSVDGRGHDGASGGGASAVVRASGEVMVVAGAGGGGGGDGYSDGDDSPGGIGGAGGNPAQAGFDADTAVGGNGGRPGAGGPAGEDGEGAGLVDMGGGGGGGAGFHGGGAGDSGSIDDGEDPGGGGGGAGGSSAVEGDAKEVGYYTAFSCPYPQSGSQCDGEVSLHWSPPLTPLDPLATGLVFPATPLVRVLGLLPTDLVEDGLPISVTPVAPDDPVNPDDSETSPLDLKLMHRCHGKWRAVASGSVRPSHHQARRTTLKLERRHKRHVKRCWHSRRHHRHVPLKLTSSFEGETETKAVHLYG